MEIVPITAKDIAPSQYTLYSVSKYVSICGGAALIPAEVMPAGILKYNAIRQLSERSGQKLSVQEYGHDAPKPFASGDSHR